MGLNRLVAIAAGVAFIGVGPGPITAGAAPARPDDRLSQAAFAAWKARHPNLDAEIADLKSKTAAVIAAYVPYVPALTPETQTATNELRLDQPSVVWRAPGALREIWDSADSPEMVVIPAGEYTMGSTAAEPGRRNNEEPRHRVRIGYPLAVSKYPVTVREFAKFVADTGRIVANQCQNFVDGKWENVIGCTWRTVSFSQGDDHPVVAVDWDDAQAYAAWLTKKTGHAYRLLSEAEYEYANRAGTMTPYWWGDDPAAACAHANGADLDAKAQPQFSDWRVNNCHDGHAFTAPVAAFGPNPFGLYGTTGNTWSWTGDCWNDSYHGAPTDGSANLTGICTQRVIRGGAWAETPENLRSAKRGWNLSNIRFAMNSFRVARVL